VRKGLCAHCGSEPLVTQTLGERCARQARDAKAKRDAARAAAEGRMIAPSRCRTCGLRGRHECIDSEDFMSAPSALAAEMSREGGGGTGSGKWKRREAA